MLRGLKQQLDRICIHRLVVYDDDLNPTVLSAREKMTRLLAIASVLLLGPPFFSVPDQVSLIVGIWWKHREPLPHLLIV